MINHILSIFSVYFCENKKIYDKRWIHLTCFLFVFIKKNNGAASQQFFSSHLCYSIWNINIIFILNRIRLLSHCMVEFLAIVFVGWLKMFLFFVKQPLTTPWSFCLQLPNCLQQFGTILHSMPLQSGVLLFSCTL